MEWYSFEPIDTLFFRGAEPMEMGEDHSAVHIFPPMPQTIAGALKTAFMIQKGVDFNKYRNGEVGDSVIEIIGKPCSEKSGFDYKEPFEVVGPLFLKNEEVFIPAPYCWYIDKSEKIKVIGSMDDESSEEVQIIKSKKIDENIIKTKSRSIFWAKPEKDELLSAGGFWIRYEDFKNRSSKLRLYSISYFVGFEQRTGIALKDVRSARSGHIYSFNHARLREGVRIIFATSKNLPLEKRGVLKLGAEQRFGKYEKEPSLGKKMDFLFEVKGKAEEFLALSVIPKSEAANRSIVATGKIAYVGGWDLCLGFHKDMIGYFPAGSVFEEKINESCIEIE